MSHSNKASFIAMVILTAFTTHASEPIPKPTQTRRIKFKKRQARTPEKPIAVITQVTPEGRTVARITSTGGVKSIESSTFCIDFSKPGADITKLTRTVTVTTMDGARRQLDLFNTKKSTTYLDLPTSEKTDTSTLHDEASEEKDSKE